MTHEQALQRIHEGLDDIRPNIEMDGGDIQFVSYNDGIVSVRLLGACVGCPLSVYTLKMGIEEHLKTLVPDIVEVVAVT
ncbi:NifU family protein [Candidatus Dependentiae bacterium]|nr:NifU family protein [Candidatus Dependentiae bacterium]